MTQVSETIEDKVKSIVREFAGSIKTKSTSIAAFNKLVTITSDVPLSSFDYWERMIGCEYSRNLQTSNLPKWNFWSKPKPTELEGWLELICRDGFKREKALQTISGPAPNTFFFSLAVRRLNDWVPQVRQAARQALPKITKTTDPHFVVEALYIAFSNWNSWGRIQEIDKKILLQIICDEKIAILLKSKVTLSPSGPMPSLFSQLGRTSILDDKIEEIATFAVQPMVRAKAYRALYEKRITWFESWHWEWDDIRYCKRKRKAIIGERTLEINIPLLELIRRSSEDRSSIVRSVSAEILIRELSSLGSDANRFADKFALDESNTVSERGQFALKKIANEADNSRPK